MILPQSLLEKLESYSVGYASTNPGRTTIVTIYFEDWWRIRRKYKFPWITTHITADDISTRVEPSEASELIAQLKEYFSNQPYERKRNYIRR